MQDNLTRLVTGDQQVFKLVFDHYFPIIYRRIYSRLHDEEQTDDLVQEVFLALWLGREKLTNVESLDAYLSGIAKNQLHSYFRRNKKRLLESDYTEAQCANLYDETTEPDYVLETKQLRQDIEKIVESMPATMMRCFQLYHKERYSIKEIAMTLSLNEQTVKNHLSVAKDRIKKLLPQLGFLAILFFKDTI